MSRFKTELCNNLIELGSCKYGERCHYAHGAHELRQVTRRHPKYRTERCKNFELTGKCPFGPRCSYVHPKPDLESLVEQLTRYVHHTKAPKPDSEDDDDEENVVDVFSRTMTSASLYSMSESTNSNLSNSNPLLADTEANKENQVVINNHKELNSFGGKFHIDHEKDTYRMNRADDPYSFNNQDQRSIPARPLSSLKNYQNQQNAFDSQLTAQKSNISKVIERPTSRNAMQIISKNNQTINFNSESPPLYEPSNCNSIVTPPPPPEFASPLCSLPPSNTINNNPFGVNNPFGGFFTNPSATSNLRDRSSSSHIKQCFTRF